MRLLNAFLLTLFALTPAAAQADQTQTAGRPTQTPAAGQSSAAVEMDALDGRVRELLAAKKYDEAANQAQAAVDVAARLYGDNSKEVSGQLSVLANVYLTRGDTGKAKKALARLLEVREKRPGPSETFEQSALQRYTCLLAASGPNSSDRDLAERISRVFVQDSVLAQGFRLSPDEKELQVGAATSKPQPYYPTEAKATHTSGSAVMLISIDATGRVTDVTPLDCSTKLFTAAGANAARHATFKPTLVGGKPVGVRSIIFYRWVIN